jgi:hypothetical protein
MTEEERFRGIALRWPRHHWDGDGRSRWAHWGWRHYLFILIFALLVSVSMVEKTISDNGEKQPWPFFGWLAESPSGFAVLAVLILLNAWFIDRGLADRTPFEGTLPGWLHCFRRAAVAVPILGLYTIPVWHWVIRSRPAWAFRSSATSRLGLSNPRTKPVGALSLLHIQIDSLRRTQSSSFLAYILWMIAGQIAPWLGLLSWITTANSLSPGRRAVLEGLSISFRILACAFAMQYGVLRGRQIRASGWRLYVLRFAPILFLLPFPSLIVGIVPWMIAVGEEEESLIGRSWEGKNQASPQAARARWASRPSTLSMDRESSEVIDAQSAFHRLKTLLLFLDAGALAWVLTLAGQPLFSFNSFPLREIAPYLFLAALGLLAEGVLLAQRLLGWFRRQELSSLPYGRSVTFTQLALIAGLLFGSLLAVNKAATAGHLLVVTGLSAVLLSALIFGPASFLLARPRNQTFMTLAWVLLFFEAFVVGAVMYSQPELAPPFVVLFRTALAFTPVWSIALFFGLGGWLIHPFRLRHLFDQRLPGSTRAVLMAVALTAAFPMGGLAIPFWIYAQNRLWPRYELLLWNLVRNDAS